MTIIIEVESRIRIGMMNTKGHTMATEDIEDRMTDMTMVMADMDQVMAAVPTAGMANFYSTYLYLFTYYL